MILTKDSLDEQADVYIPHPNLLKLCFVPGGVKWRIDRLQDRRHLPHFAISNDWSIILHKEHRWRSQRRTLYLSSTRKQLRVVPWNKNCSLAGLFWEGELTTRTCALRTGLRTKIVYQNMLTDLYSWKGLRLASDDIILKTAWTWGICFLGCFQASKNLIFTARKR